jgi:hypothetical protein
MIVGGMLLVMKLSNPFPGLVVCAFGLYGAWLICSGIRRA